MYSHNSISLTFRDFTSCNNSSSCSNSSNVNESLSNISPIALAKLMPLMDHTSPCPTPENKDIGTLLASFLALPAHGCYVVAGGVSVCDEMLFVMNRHRRTDR